ncbi:hypothetical protein V8G54_029538 [Vigna mungo]|uniref:Putative E3 ubiquitin-protein ligase LIN N-terminal domain-containing protein n=1 Tax=Vigna mungo TaxID=3915 RepID=A0AAQ3MUG0_VIGMU
MIRKYRLINKEQRAQHKEQCAERLAAEEGSCDKDSEVEYSDQAVLANLDWGIEALEEAINTYNMETKLARLDYAEKMLQLRNSIQNSVLHALEMFIVDPFFSRIDFAPELWTNLFLPHMSSIVGWYSEERHRLMMEVIPDSSDLSFTADFDRFFNESLLYAESLDENTRLYAKYYKDCMNSDSTSGKKAAPMLPIAEPPRTPLHELSRSVPDFVKFGPILPKSAGFSLTTRSKDVINETIRKASLRRMRMKMIPILSLMMVQWIQIEETIFYHQE